MRALRVHCVCMHTRIAPRVTGAMAYMTPLRRTVAMRPVRASFLLMRAPLPTSTLPLVAGFLIPPSELPFSLFVSGAFPSKLLHFACDVLVGVEVPRHRG